METGSTQTKTCLLLSPCERQLSQDDFDSARECLSTLLQATTIADLAAGKTKASQVKSS